MAQILCFADSAAIAFALEQGLQGSEHQIYTLSASHLTNAVRETVQQLAPDIVLLELTPALDNAHLYFFLRADQATRHVPVILISSSARVEQHAAVLLADGFLQRPFADAQLYHLLDALLPRQTALVAA